MNEPLVIRVRGDRYHVRLPNGQWHQYRSEREAAELLWGADLNAYALIQEAFVEPTPIGDIQFRRFGRHRWWVNNRPQPVTVVRYLLRESGCNKEQAEHIIRSLRLCADAQEVREEIERATREIGEEFREWLLSAKSGLARKGDTAVKSAERFSAKRNSATNKKPRTRRGTIATKS